MRRYYCIAGASKLLGGTSNNTNLYDNPDPPSLRRKALRLYWPLIIDHCRLTSDYFLIFACMIFLSLPHSG